MVNTITKKAFLFVTALLLSITMLLPAQVSAANVQMNLASSASTVVEGDTFNVSVRLVLGSSQSFDALATVSYDSSKVQYLSADYSPSSEYGSAGPDDGPINNSSYRVDGWFEKKTATGTVTIATLRFKALTSSGSTNFSLSDADVSDAASPPPAEHSVSTSGVSVSFKEKPVVTPSSNQQPASGSSTQPATGVPSSEESEANAQYDDDQPVEANALADSATYDIAITIYDDSGLAKDGVSVWINDTESQTDDKGVARFSGLSAGVYTVSVDGTDQEIEVLVGDPEVEQLYTITVDGSDSLLSRVQDYALPIAIGLAVLAVIVLLALSLKTYISKKKMLSSGGDPAVLSSMETHQSAEDQEATEEAKRMEEFLKPNPPSAETVIRPDENREE